MPAIITDNFRKQNRENLVALMDPLSSPTRFFVGLGKSDPWDENESLSTYTAPVSGGSVKDKLDAVDNLISLKSLDGVSTLVPKNTWSSGRKYKVYNPTNISCLDYTSGIHPCYVYNETGKTIYMCLSKPSDGTLSINEPTSADYEPFQTADGYVWVKVFFNNLTTDLFYSSANFIPVEDPAIPDTSCSGILYGFNIENGGSAYTATTGTITVDVKYNDGSSDTLVINVSLSVSSGIIRRVYLPVASIGVGNADIVRASVVSSSITGGTGAVFTPLITPIDGFNSHVLDVLPSYFIGVSANFEDDMDGDVSTNVSYRQVTVIQDPLTNDSPLSFTSMDALKHVEGELLSGSVTVGNTAGKIITFSNGAKAFVDYIELISGADYRFFFHQNSSTSINRLTPESGTATLEGATIDIGSPAVIEPEYVSGTGEVLFIENRKPITRANNQIDNVRIVIQL